MLTLTSRLSARLWPAMDILACSADTVEEPVQLRAPSISLTTSFTAPRCRSERGPGAEEGPATSSSASLNVDNQNAQDSLKSFVCCLHYLAAGAPNTEIWFSVM